LSADANDSSADRSIPPLRNIRPLYVDRLPPCNHACPAGENIQGWLAEAQAGRYRAAWDILVRDNPMPAVHGRVCYHPCEDVCNRREVDEPVSVHAVERFLGDLALEERWAFEPAQPASGKRVLVVGAGPSGLSAAYHLTRLGHAVTIHEAGPMSGGMMHFGIPKYRLPREVLDAEIRRIEALGVTIVLNHKVKDLLAEQQAGRFDAVFVAVGAHLSKRQSIPSQDAGRIFDALQFLRDVESGAEAPKIGRRVAVYGGGNTAMDAARTARRLGAETVIIYRRTREQMPAHDFEADEALDEGVSIRWLRTIKEIHGSTITVEVMRLDGSGFPQPTGEVETLEADSLVLALGQETDTSFLEAVPGVQFAKDGTVLVAPDMMTGRPGIFAGGDMVPSERTVTTAVGHGKKAARYIDAWLAGRVAHPHSRPEIATGGMLHLWYDVEALRARQAAIDLTQRTSTFDEVVHGLDAGAARYEAQRCLSCGNCFECDGCFSACPEHAILKLGPGRRYLVDLALCTGCAVCFDQCPCAAITMVVEPGPMTAGATGAGGMRR
jgi:NADPH-dependent glutamate synthase beta subunit-like oxidoreductase